MSLTLTYTKYKQGGISGQNNKWTIPKNQFTNIEVNINLIYSY